MEHLLAEMPKRILHKAKEITPKRTTTMPKEIPFKKITTFQGRNGTGKCTGILISNLGDNLWIAPITSKGSVGNCGIEIPKEDLPKLIKALKNP